MAITMKRAFVKKELANLLASEKQMFLPSDRADDRSYWAGARAYWIMKGENCAGRIDVCPNMRFTDGEDWSRTEGWLYVQSFGLNREFQKSGFREIGPDVVLWLIGYARKHGFKGISTNEREGTSRELIKLYANYGIREVRRTSDYFTGPVEPNVVLELVL